MRTIGSMFAGAVASAGLALVVFACSSDGERSGNVFPSQSSTSSGGSSGSSTSGGSSSGGSSGSTSSSGNVPDAEAEAAAGDAGSCAALPAQIDMIAAATLPDDTGGAVVDGTFALTKAELVDDQTAPGDPVGKKKAAVIVFSGNKMTWHWDREIFFQMAEDKCCEGTFSIINGNELNMGLTCNGTNSLIVAKYTVVSPTEIRVKYGDESDTFTKQ